MRRGVGVTSVEELPDEIKALYPDDVRALYELHEWRNATVVFKKLHPQEWDELMTVLSTFRLLRSNIIKGGGNKSAISRGLDGHLLEFGWKRETFDTTITVSTRVTQGTTTYDVPTHEVDCFKSRVALEVEWNNKDPFYDRDLNNFRLLFELRVIDLGIIITRTDDLQDIFNKLGRKTSFGESTTHMRKLLPKVEGGGAGGCPVIVFGISPALYVEDEEPISPEEIAQAELVERAEAVREDGDE
jgi:hypothetical protein